MKSIVICEKPSQARAIRAAIGNRHGEVLPAAGHLLTLKEPDEVREEWAGQWKPGLLWPGDFYEKKVIPNTRKYFEAIRAAARGVDRIVIATDCDREGQLIGQEIVDFIGFRGEVLRAIFNAEDPKSLQQAFGKLTPNVRFQGLYEAGRAREQSDQATNLSLTRTATCVLKAPGSKGAIGIGRVKTPVLAILCRREEEILNFRPQDWFEVDADVAITAGSITLSCAKLPKSLLKEQEGDPEGAEEDLDETEAALAEMQPLRGRILKREIAEALAADVRGARHPLKSSSERKTQGPPRLFDLTGLQAAASARFGWSGEKTLDIAQKLYSDRTLITYPRGEAKHLPEANIADVPVLLGALLRLPGLGRHAALLREPVIRKGKSGHFSDKALEGFSHYAIIPNVNTAGDFGRAVAGLTEDEARLFDMIARQYMAALAPDHVYRQTIVEMVHPWKGHDWLFRTTGRVPLIPGWKEVLGTSLEKDAQPELPAVKDGETGTVTEARTRTVTTKPPARYTEGALIKVMQEAWRLVPAGDMRERLREAKGIGTPATRGEVLKGLKEQGQITAKGKTLMPTPGGMELWRVLRETCPNVVDPARTALWETMFDAIEKGRMTAGRVVEGILKETEREIAAIVARKGQAAIAIGKSAAPTPKMVQAAKSIAERKGIRLPKGTLTDASACRAFLDTHMGGRPEGEGPRPPSEKQLALAQSLAERTGRDLPSEARACSRALSAWIDAAMAAAPPRPPSEKQLAFARSLAERADIDLPEKAAVDAAACKAFIDARLGQQEKGGKRGAPAGRSGASGRGRRSG